MALVGQLGKPKGGNSTKKIKIEFNKPLSDEELRDTTFTLNGAELQKKTDEILIKSLVKTGKTLDKNFKEHFRLRLEEIENTDGYGKHTQSRKEQGILRAILFKDVHETKCAICQRTLPTDLMVAAHIKPRSKCTTSERTNPNIVMPVCKVGCDDFYEKGYILVDSNGVIKTNSKVEYSSQLRKVIREIIGKQCTHFSNDTAQFFEDKRNRFNGGVRI